MKKISYKNLNDIFYKKKIVKYSWKKQNLKKIKQTLDPKLKIETIQKHEWRNIEFIRDGSFFTLEDTLILKNKNKIVGAITPTRAVMFETFPKKLASFFNKPIGLKKIAVLLVLITITLMYFVMSV